MSPRFKIAYVPWYRPVRLVTRLLNKGDERGFEFVGWVWRQKAYLVNNLNYGWIAFLEDQRPEMLEICPSCKRNLHLPVGE